MTSGPQKSQSLPLDEVDQELLDLLSKDSRRTNQSLSEALGLAPSTCLARLKALKQSGAIKRFTIEIDPESVIHHLLAHLDQVDIQYRATHLVEFHTRGTTFVSIR